MLLITRLRMLTLDWFGFLYWQFTMKSDRCYKWSIGYRMYLQRISEGFLKTDRPICCPIEDVFWMFHFLILTVSNWLVTRLYMWGVYCKLGVLHWSKWFFCATIIIERFLQMPAPLTQLRRFECFFPIIQFELKVTLKI